MRGHSQIVFKTLADAKAVAGEFAGAFETVPGYFEWEEFLLRNPEWARYSGTLLYYSMTSLVERFGTQATFRNPFWQALGAAIGEAITIHHAQEQGRDRDQTL